MKMIPPGTLRGWLAFALFQIASTGNAVDVDYSGLSFRAIGPAHTSGRVSDLAVNPTDPSEFYVAAASGGVWKTVNGGTTWKPLFDDQGAYSIGVVVIDPNDDDTVWVGTGENNSQRSVSYGDGVYRSLDGGKSWRNMGLADSQHIGKILIDPRDSNRVFVAAQGPLWNAGGDRGLYATEDGGENWTRVLDISPDTGVNEVLFHPANPDILYASSYQRRRHTWVLINGGPESAIYKSVDGGKQWRKMDQGLPGGDLGRIGLAVSPADPDRVYAIIEALGDEAGVYLSRDRGDSWTKTSDYMTSSPQYYNELVVDPVDANRVYAMDTWLHVSEDSGSSFSKVPERHKHVDNHALWINPHNTRHLLAGCDGGVYQSYDRGQNWGLMSNLPIVQFYRATPDNDLPYYNVYGGTQDNSTLGGPSRTTNVHGIQNRDWFTTVGGDGYKTQIDPLNPDIVYSQYQYGGLVRYDRKTGERVDIRPQPSASEPALRWNWNSPLIISPHSPSRLYFAANRLFRSDNRGKEWRPVSDDLTRQIDRNKLKVMDRVWSENSVSKNASTSYYGNVVSLAESPVAEGVIYTGNDDGLIQVTRDGGKQWRKAKKAKGVPDFTYVSDLEASLFKADVVFAAFDNHKQGDFKPYVYVSTDRGMHWKSISGDLPQRGSVHTLAQDHVEPDLLFVGTEFGLFFTRDRGDHWQQLKTGLPTIAIRDLEIQRRENDLVLGSFGRGLFIFDDYSPLRVAAEKLNSQEGTLLPARPSLMYIEANPQDLSGKSFFGDAHFAAPNPPYGTVITYYLRDGYETAQSQRREAEAERAEKGEDTPYPTWDTMRTEEQESDPQIVITILTAGGEVVRRLVGPTEPGFHRVAWDHRYPSSTPARDKPWPQDNPFYPEPVGALALPGVYQVTVEAHAAGQRSMLDGPGSFAVSVLQEPSWDAADRSALLAFQRDAVHLQRAVLGAVNLVGSTESRLKLIRIALNDTPTDNLEMVTALESLESELRGLKTALQGDRTIRSHNEPDSPSIEERIDVVVSGSLGATSSPTGTQRDQYEIAATAFASIAAELNRLIKVDLLRLEGLLEKSHAPWTPGRVPEWTEKQGEPG